MLLAALLLSSCQAPPPGGGRRIVTSIGPLADWARHVAGPRWTVASVLPPGASPHTYEFRPRDVADASRARLGIRIGVGLDPYMDRLAAAAGLHNLLTVSDGVTLINGNPHVWLDPGVARATLFRIAAALSALEPGDSAGFTRRAMAYAESMDSVDAEYRAASAHFHTRSFVSFHGAWSYLGSRYGLVEAGSIEPAPGREPGPSDWRRLVDLLHATGARAVFSEPQFGARLPQALARDASVRVLALDPLGSTGDPGGESYVTLMRHNLRALEDGLR